MSKKISYLTMSLGLGCALSLWATPVAAQDAFFKGKTMRIVVGFAAGGGFDTYARAISRHMGKHIPGNPTIIVENMPGAGSLIAANHVYKVAKPDGLTIGHFGGGLFMQQLKGGGESNSTRKNSNFLACRSKTPGRAHSPKQAGLPAWTGGWRPKRRSKWAPQRRGTWFMMHRKFYRRRCACRFSLSPGTKARRIYGLRLSPES